MSDSDSGAGGQAEATSSPSKILNEVSDAVQNMDVLGVEGFELTAVEMDTLRSLQMRMKVTMRKSKDQLENFLKSSERGEIIRRRANSVSETVKDVKDQVKFRAHDVSEQVKTRANEAKEKVKVRAKDAQEKVTRRVRQVVTGDGDKRVRDEVTRHVRKAVTGDSDKRVREWIKDPPVVKAIDKVCVLACGLF
jgi:gas vesicle protein